MMTSHRQCPRGGACECPRVGVFSNFGRVDDVTRAMSKGGVLVVICVKFRANQPLCPPLTKAFPYAYAHTYFTYVPTHLYAHVHHTHIQAHTHTHMITHRYDEPAISVQHYTGMIKEHFTSYWVQTKRKIFQCMHGIPSQKAK